MLLFSACANSQTHAPRCCHECFGTERNPAYPNQPFISPSLSAPPPVSALSAEQARVLAHLDSVLVVPEAMQAENGKCRCEAAQ